MLNWPGTCQPTLLATATDEFCKLRNPRKWLTKISGKSNNQYKISYHGWENPIQPKLSHHENSSEERTISKFLSILYKLPVHLLFISHEMPKVHWWLNVICELLGLPLGDKGARAKISQSELIYQPFLNAWQIECNSVEDYIAYWSSSLSNDADKKLRIKPSRSPSRTASGSETS